MERRRDAHSQTIFTHDADFYLAFTSLVQLDGVIWSINECQSVNSRGGRGTDVITWRTTLVKGRL